MTTIKIKATEGPHYVWLALKSELQIFLLYHTKLSSV